ncbi:hypothetical protein FEK33_17385 [Nocardia asteroides NBRC 15531]|uniref:Uncharacterized protein n=1 Tax=Nocardia asteroides NBRC 15531 TaxID=1110697 RepID=U5EAE8_NOCAS|nr:hypothetical protein [Nocardia asteroides]TLF67684.1 hypothetical protein FEK33_17385 [Nocardia asteroides NBRC 15531]UGT50754.1 hypothetical protein LT345_09520 [Nocardia asteroides]SFN82216.1 hypothetical protein SAMN05444423_11533 [Nocardia asteroides]VEG36404.1 Uncharacterised protein [Nocardia asteroides]GAD83406.1 hypothetical protein NCAST_19_01090 [Nocardia asteroides NBRC 15531]
MGRGRAQDFEHGTLVWNGGDPRSDFDPPTGTGLAKICENPAPGQPSQAGVGADVTVAEVLAAHHHSMDGGQRAEGTLPAQDRILYRPYRPLSVLKQWHQDYKRGL